MHRTAPNVDAWPEPEPDQSPTRTPSFAPTHATVAQCLTRHPVTPQAALLAAAIKSKPATYAESCGAKSTVPPKRSSVKATTLLALACSISAMLPQCTGSARVPHTQCTNAALIY